MSMENRILVPVLRGCVPLYRETTSNHSGILFTTVDNLSLFFLIFYFLINGRSRVFDDSLIFVQR